MAMLRIRAVGNIFPVVLYTVASMVSLYDHDSFVDEERTHAGILRPWVTVVGYYHDFLLYGLVAGTVGTALGSMWSLLLASVFQVSLQRHGGGRNPDSVLLDL